jgi:predicted nucleic acid-binding protein
MLAALNKSFELLLSVPLILEYEAALTRPEHLAACGLNRVAISHLLDDLAAVAEPVKIVFRWRSNLPDPDDDMVLETAVNGRADAIVTFNMRHFEPASRSFNRAVLLPRDALQQMRS